MSRMIAVNATLDSKNIPGMIPIAGGNATQGMPLGKVLCWQKHSQVWELNFLF